MPTTATTTSITTATTTTTACKDECKWQQVAGASNNCAGSKDGKSYVHKICHDSDAQTFTQTRGHGWCIDSIRSGHYERQIHVKSENDDLLSHRECKEICASDPLCVCYVTIPDATVGHLSCAIHTDTTSFEIYPGDNWQFFEGRSNSFFNAVAAGWSADQPHWEDAECHRQDPQYTSSSLSSCKRRCEQERCNFMQFITPPDGDFNTNAGEGSCFVFSEESACDTVVSYDQSTSCVEVLKPPDSDCSQEDLKCWD